MKKKKSIIIVLIVILVLLALVAGGAYLYFLTDLFKSNAELFYEYAAKHTELAEMVKLSDNSIGQNDKYTTKIKIGFDLTSTDIELADETLPARNFSIEYNGKTDKENRLASAEAKLKYLANDLFTVKYLQTGDVYGIKSDEVINKYLAIENNHLQDLAAKYQIEGEFPDKISFEKASSPITKQQLETIKNICLPVLQNNIPESAFSKKKDVAINVYHKNLNVTEYSLVLNKTQVNHIVVQILEALKQDNAALTILLDRTEYETIEELKEAIQNEINEMNLDTEEIVGYLVMNLYQSQGTLHRSEITINEKTITIDFDKSETSTSKRALITTKALEIGAEYGLDSIELVQGDSNGSKQNIMIFKLSNQDQENLTISFQKKASMGDILTDNVIININANDETYFKITMDKQVEFVDEIEIEKLDDSNSAKFNDFAPEYGLQTLEAITMRVTQVFTEKWIQLMTMEENQQQGGNQNEPQPTNPISQPTPTPQDTNTIEANNQTNTLIENNTVEPTNQFTPITPVEDNQVNNTTI